MKTFIILSAVLAVALAKPGQHIVSPLGVPIVLSPRSINYHSQDILGQYAYGYNNDLSAKQEVHTLDGVTRGSYRYLDANNVVQTVDYTADAVNGFRVAGTNLPRALPVDNAVLPQPVVDTPEVVAARASHLAETEKVQEGRSLESDVDVPVVVDVELPKQVEDTPEVVAAREAHLKAVKEAEARSLIAPIAPVIPPTPIVAAPFVPRFIHPNFRFIHPIGAPLPYGPFVF